MACLDEIVFSRHYLPPIEQIIRTKAAAWNQHSLPA